MNLQRLGEHTVDVDLLPEAPLVMDVGCRGFQFSEAILKLRPRAKIIALDPDPTVRSSNPNIAVFHWALVGSLRPHWFKAAGDGSCVQDTPTGGPKVACITIQTIRRHQDLVKLDCEGSEFEILEQWSGPVATQISVEFHDYTDRQRWDSVYFDTLFNGPLKDYRVVQHELSEISPGAWGHWDTLLVLK